MNMESFGYMSRRSITESYDSSIFKFLREQHTDFRSGCTSLPFLKKWFIFHNIQNFCHLFFNDSHSNKNQIESQSSIDLLFPRRYKIENFL